MPACTSSIDHGARIAPWGPTEVERPSERAVRTESDTVRTTPVHVMAQTATVVVPTKTATGTVKSSVMLTAASATLTPAHR